MVGILVAYFRCGHLFKPLIIAWLCHNYHYRKVVLPTDILQRKKILCVWTYNGTWWASTIYVINIETNWGLFTDREWGVDI